MDELFWLILKIATCFFLVNGVIIASVFTIHVSLILISLIYRNGSDLAVVWKNREELKKPLPPIEE